MKNYTIKDDRTREDVEKTKGFVVATDKFMSGWGSAPGKSYVAVPFISAEDRERIEIRMRRRPEMKRIRIVYGKKYRPSLHSGDHLHIYNIIDSFRYAL